MKKLKEIVDVLSQIVPLVCGGQDGGPGSGQKGHMTNRSSAERRQVLSNQEKEAGALRKEAGKNEAASSGGKHQTQIDAHHKLAQKEFDSMKPGQNNTPAAIRAHEHIKAIKAHEKALKASKNGDHEKATELAKIADEKSRQSLKNVKKVLGP